MMQISSIHELDIRSMFRTFSSVRARNYKIDKVMKTKIEYLLEDLL